MFDSFLIRQDSLKNTIEDGKITGFQFDIRIADYRGCFLSLHTGYYINVDGKEYPRSVQKLGINGKPPRDFDEIKTCVWEHWDYDDYGTVYVSAPGGLEPGMHSIGVLQCVFTQYGWDPHDEEWIQNPPEPGSPEAGGKTKKVCWYDMEIK